MRFVCGGALVQVRSRGEQVAPGEPRCSARDPRYGARIGGRSVISLALAACLCLVFAAPVAADTGAAVTLADRYSPVIMLEPSTSCADPVRRTARPPSTSSSGILRWSSATRLARSSSEDQPRRTYHVRRRAITSISRKTRSVPAASTSNQAMVCQRQAGRLRARRDRLPAPRKAGRAVLVLLHVQRLHEQARR